MASPHHSLECVLFRRASPRDGACECGSTSAPAFSPGHVRSGFLSGRRAGLVHTAVHLELVAGARCRLRRSAHFGLARQGRRADYGRGWGEFRFARMSDPIRARMLSVFSGSRCSWDVVGLLPRSRTRSSSLGTARTAHSHPIPTVQAMTRRVQRPEYECLPATTLLPAHPGVLGAQQRRRAPGSDAGRRCVSTSHT